MPLAVRFEEVSKEYPRGGQRYHSLRHEVSGVPRRLAARVRGSVHGQGGHLALDRVSFTVGEGETVALIGPNGAGKTTALKLVSRISSPTGGRLHVRGRVGALIEVGSGIHPELTARENIWLYGRILGMSKADVRRRFDQIVDFAELGHVLDTPVKTFSSGMQLRLGFAVASHVDPDIFVIDEALAVGDEAFQAKCIERITTLVGEGRSLLFVSHSLVAVQLVCQRAVLLGEGRVVADGSTPSVVAGYLEGLARSRRDDAGSDGALRLVGASCHGLDGEERYRFGCGEGTEIRLALAADRPVPRPELDLGIATKGPYLLLQCSAPADDDSGHPVRSRWEYRCRMSDLPFQPMVYRLYCRATGWPTWREALAFEVAAEDERVLSASDAVVTAPVRVRSSWTVTGADDS